MQTSGAQEKKPIRDLGAWLLSVFEALDGTVISTAVFSSGTLPQLPADIAGMNPPSMDGTGGADIIANASRRPLRWGVPDLTELTDPRQVLLSLLRSPGDEE